MEEFCGVTGADPETARHFLDAAAGDLDAAVALFLDSNLGGPASLEEDAIRAPIQASISRLQESDHDLFGRAAAYYPSRRRSQNSNTVFGRELSSSSSSSENESIVPPQQRLARLFRRPRKIAFQGTFEEARRAARTTTITGPSTDNNFRFIVVSVFKADEFACQAANRDFWNSRTVRALFGHKPDGNDGAAFIFYQVCVEGAGDEQDEAALVFCSQYGIDVMDPKVHPFIGIVDPRTGEMVWQWQGERVRQWSAGQLLEALGEYLQGSGDVIGQAEAKVMPPVYAYEKPEPAESDPEAVTVQLRLPDGRRLKRRFFRNEKCVDVLAFAASCIQAPCSVRLASLDIGNVPEKTVVEANLRNASLLVIPQADQE